MEDEVISNDVAETFEEPVVISEDTSVDTSGEVLENGDGTQEPEQKPAEEYKPWKKSPVPETIPYQRFSEVVSERKQLEERLAQKEKELEEYYKTKKIVDGMDLSDIDPDQQTIEEVLQKVAIKVKTQVQAETAKAEEAKRISEIETRIADEFTKKVEKASAKNPEITEAVKYINTFAQHMPKETRYALVTDDNVGEVLYDIATTEGLLEQILRMNPIDAARKIAKISAKYDSQDDGSNLSKATQRNVEIPKVMPKSTGTPPKPSQTSKPTLRYSDDMPMSQYMKLRSQGKI